MKAVGKKSPRSMVAADAEERLYDCVTAVGVTPLTMSQRLFLPRLLDCYWNSREVSIYMLHSPQGSKVPNYRIFRVSIFEILVLCGYLILGDLHP